MNPVTPDAVARPSPLALAHAANAERRAAGIPNVYLDPLEKARRNPHSLRLAINGKCWDCIGAGADPKPRTAISLCSCTSCALWNVRPYQTLAVEDHGEDEGGAS